jgi:LmbE family N-acetylglucosaminyl deacetylase
MVTEAPKTGDRGMIREYLRRSYRSLLPLLYARTNFKLFLKTTFADMDVRVQQLASLTDYFSNSVRSIPIRAPFGRSMLVVAPHQDDEAIGCGGALALQVRAKGAASIVILQDGADGHEELGLKRQDMVSLRNEESRRASRVLGIEPPRFLNHPNLASVLREAAEELRNILIDKRVDAIFLPFLLDNHPDHRTANYIAAEALKSVDWDVRVFGYEVWSLCIPNVIVVIDEVIDQKISMLSCFDFANKAVDYVQSTKGLNMYHSRMLGAGICKYAERFFEVPKDEYIELIQKAQTAETGRRIPEAACSSSPRLDGES